MSTDLSYVTYSPNKDYLKLKLNIGKDSQEKVFFDNNFIILRHNSSTRILYVDQKMGIVSGIHFEKESEKQKLLGMYTSPEHRRKGYMRCLLSYAKHIETTFWLSDDFTKDGDAYIAKNGTEINAYKAPSKKDNDLFIEISKIFFELDNSRIPQGQITKEKISYVKDLHKKLNNKLKTLQKEIKKKLI